MPDARALVLCARLAWRRALTPWTLGAWIALAMLCLFGGERVVPTAIADAPALLGLQARAFVLLPLALFGALVLLARAAGAGAEARTEAGDFLAASAASAGLVPLGVWLGHVGAGTLLLVAATAAAELGTGAGGPALERLSAGVEGALALRDEAAATLVLPPIAALARATRVEVDAIVLPEHGPTATLALALGTERIEARVGGRGTLSLALPPDAARDRGLTLTLACPGADALVLVPAGGVALLAPVALGVRSAGARFCAGTALALAAALALALGLGAWMRAGLAFGLVVALAAAPLPLLRGRLVEHSSALFSGRVPAWPGTGEWGSALALVALGLGLAALGERRGRRA